jgi:prepilin-type N-terminal cleavage/methylation domain-containing protein
MTRLRLRSEEGYTLIEMTTAMTILALVSVIYLAVMASVQKDFERQSDRSFDNDQARLAVEHLDREIRSGNVLYDPSLENDPGNGVYPGMSLRIYTQTNANIRNPGNRCVQWRVLGGELQRRDWATTWQVDGNVTPWRVVAENIVNQPNPPNPPTVPVFGLDPDPNKGGRTIVVTLLVNEDPDSGSAVRIDHSLTGRNTQYGYPNNICAVIPPY